MRGGSEGTDAQAWAPVFIPAIVPGRLRILDHMH